LARVGGGVEVIVDQSAVATKDSGADAPFTVTARCIITLRSDGLQIQGMIHAAPFYVGLSELELLSAVNGGHETSLEGVVRDVAQRTGTDSRDLWSFVKRVRYARQLVPAARRVRAHLPAAPTLAGGARFDLSGEQQVALWLPQVFRISGGRFELVDHDGRRIAVLSPAEVVALESMIRPATPAAALEVAQARVGVDSLPEERFGEILQQLSDAGMLRTIDPVAMASDQPPTIDRDLLLREIFDRHAREQTAAEREREARTGTRRTKVVPVAFDMGTPVGVGMVVACAKAFDNGALEQVYDFRCDWVWDDARLDEFTAEPAVFLFSNYLWSHAQCIAISAEVKRRNPACVTIHGGPDTPKYEGDARGYFAAHPHVDITVRGEGEISLAETLAALAPVIGSPNPDLSVLAGVAGITYRDGDRIVRNPDRERVADLNTLASPFLTGLFDVYAQVPDLFVTLETNRGCPYGCTFCDWGSATTSRVRLYDMERVFEELEWCSRKGVSSISVADANFGMFKRDVEIAQRVADVRRANGTPNAFGVSFAKNTVKHLQEIIVVLADAGIMTQGVLSLQSIDAVTLNAIHRSNIKTERYDALAHEMRRAKLPLMVELMMGLPGQTLQSFAEDLQQCIDREVPARVNHTTLLVNSPMNDPEYLAEHGIETASPVGPGLNAVVLSTSSFSREDYGAMERLRLAFLMYENFGVLRHVARFLRQETGTREIDFYQALRVTTEADPDAWPALHGLAVFGASMMTAPMSWALVMDDLRRYLMSEYGVADDSALDAVLQSQLALLPAHGRTFPDIVTLPHDVVEWNRALLSVKEQGHREDWREYAPRLSEFGPAELTVDDPDHVVERSLGLNSELSVVGVNWELDSPLSRARLAATQLVDWVSDQILGQREPAKTP
jgi:radical SAM superfamily enzyme YgiQ (UPF0313 family)